MPGIATVYNSEAGYFDYAISNGQLVTGDGIPVNFLIQLFTSAVETTSTDPWWGNTFQTYAVGGKLIDLINAVKSGTGQVVPQARDYVKNALQVFVALGVVTSLAVSAEWQNQNGTSFIIITVSATVPGQTSPVLVKYGLSKDGLSFLVI